MSTDENSPIRKREKFKCERKYSSNIDQFPADEDEMSCKEETTDIPAEFGPALPPHLLSQLKGIESKNEDSDSDRGCLYGPKLPQYIKSPKLQETLKSQRKPEQVIGPEIPKHLLPSTNNVEVSEDEQEDESDAFYGPSLSLMSKHEQTMRTAAPSLIKIKSKESAENLTQRESWMLELPPEGAANLHLGPRQFRTKFLTDKERDRSVWTETPSSKKGKKTKPMDDEKIIRKRQFEERDKEMEKLVKKAKKGKKREESLLELHKKKLNKKAKKEAKKLESDKKPKERRPFNRDIDLQVNRFDESQKKAVVQKAQLLNSRFTQGESKFL